MVFNSSIFTNRILKVGLILVGTSLLFAAIFIFEPKNYGDGSEYNLMLQSLRSDFRLNLESKDSEFLEKEAQKYNYSPEIFDENHSHSGYFTGLDLKNYSYHFWLYSLINIPSRILLEVLDQNIFRAFQVTNVILFLILSYFIFKNSEYPNRHLKFTLLILNTSIWFTHWNHPEYFSFALILFSLFKFSKKSYALSILFSGLASTQNPPIIFFTIGVFIWSLAEDVIDKQKMYKIFNSLTKNLIYSLPAVTPFLFYYLRFGTFNLISKVGGTDLSLISIKKVLELFFDPNIGVIFFVPVAIIGVTAALISLFLKKIPKYYKLEFLFLIIIMILMCVLSTSTTNWNHSTLGTSRYAIWSIIPIGSFLLFEILSILKIKKVVSLLLWIVVFYQLIILIIGGGFTPNGRFGAYGMTPFAQVFLNNAPEFYNPSIEIFEARVLCDEKKCNYPIIYKRDEICLKALSKESEQVISSLLIKCNKDVRVDYCEKDYCYYSFN